MAIFGIVGEEDMYTSHQISTCFCVAALVSVIVSLLFAHAGLDILDYMVIGSET